MSFFISALVLIMLVLLFVFLGVGLALILGVILVIAAAFAAISFIFGGGGFSGKEVPQKFNECLLEEEPEECLQDWTTWDKDKLEMIKTLALQVQNDLGVRGASRSTEYVSETQNGQQSIRMELITDYEKKKNVKEHYLLIKKDGELRIAELKWDYQ
ncbi:MAG TPA: hypothetical protein VFO10_18980 [Oligoflexus sp.]|uniref:hypothetical protein n=1 Tax=Oligoflexus sp. TaxID=1971216 RepID=UPI002D807E93|nr:hypothetical protein [Oligoflexus sp.]HET9239353.1 hypothetical protein [Oligoflexus sp.]